MVVDESPVPRMGSRAIPRPARPRLGLGFRAGWFGAISVLGVLLVPWTLLTLMLGMGTLVAITIGAGVAGWSAVGVGSIVWAAFTRWLSRRWADLERGVLARRRVAALEAGPVDSRDERHLDRADRDLLFATQCLRVELQSGDEQGIRDTLRHWLSALRQVSTPRGLALDADGLSAERVDLVLAERARGKAPLNGLLDRLTREVQAHLSKPADSLYR